MIVNARLDISWSEIEKPTYEPDESYYDNLTEEIREKLDADNVEIISMDFYDENEEEEYIDWYPF